MREDCINRVAVRNNEKGEVIIGHVKLEFVTKQKPFIDMSYSSKEDVYKVLWILDLAESEKERFNHEALAVYHDILALAKNTDIVNEYVCIQLGYGNLTTDDYGKDIIQIIAERRSISQVECEKIMQDEIAGMVKLNKENWLDCIMNKEIYKYPERKNDDRIYFPDVNNRNIDFARKYIVKSRIQSHLEYPENLQDVINARSENQKRLNVLDAIPNRSVSEKHEFKKRISYDKSLNEDIQDLKKLYGYEYKESAGHTNPSFNDGFEDVLEYSSEDSIMDSWETDKIKSLAKEILTDKQYIVFNLYYESGLTQQEIVEVLCLLKEDISRTLKTIRTKLIDNLQ